MTSLPSGSLRAETSLQFGHAQRAWDDLVAIFKALQRSAMLQFGHAQRAWDDKAISNCHGLRQEGFNSATPRGRGMTRRWLWQCLDKSQGLQFGHAQRAWDDALEPGSHHRAG